MIFNPEESIDFNGFTAPFIQYTHARIKSILRKQQLDTLDENSITANHPLEKLEKELIKKNELFSSAIVEAAENNDPSKIAIYCFELAQIFNSFYTEHSIANAESLEKKRLRLKISQLTATVLKNGMQLLGIEVPERM